MTGTTGAAEGVAQQRGVYLRRVHSPTQNASEVDTGIDIIAIHGFDTKSPDTWQYKREDGNKINWLADEHMLPKQVPGTRIFTCDWPAELFETKDAVPFEIEELARLLLQAILGHSTERNRSILFIASCLGGLILMKALVQAENEYATIRRATRGVVFLATPFRGTSFENVAKWAQPGLQAWASIQGQQVSNLLHLVKSPTFGLAHLVSQFTRLYPIRGPGAVKVHTFYESRFTSLHRKVPCISSLLPRSRKVLVNMSSGTLDYVLDPIALDRPHVLMNKFPDPDDSDYKKLVETISRFLEEIRNESPLEQAESWIRRKHYNEQRLKIDRLSGEPLDMDRCYINLALVKTRQTDTPKDTKGSASSPFTLTERLRVQNPPEDLRVELLKLFEPRNRDEEPPRRILIRGRAGVGKTTMCKKIVHEFVHKGMWRNLFKRLLWVPLRNLQGLSKEQYSLSGMLKSIFFEPDDDGESLGDAMYQHIKLTGAQDTVFLLDGLDEITEFITDARHRLSHPGNTLLKELLNKPNVIITTRPHAALPRADDLDPLDLELETIGFSPDQVHQYIEAVMPNDKDAIEAYLQKNRIMQNLVRIPIQLDALCFTWLESSKFRDSSNAHLVPETMTAVYEAMTEELWKKDNDRLLKDGPIGSLVPAERNPFHSTEYNDLGYLAFSGLYGNVIEFQPLQRDALYEHIFKDHQANQVKQIFSLHETFARLSFLRTSGTSKKPNSESFHFIHLTFQEYFAAKHFVKAWISDHTIRYTKLDGGQVAMREIREVSCHEFLQKHKYNARYDIMLRFVAGLLDAKGDSYITKFFEELEHEPIDLLGPTHQRVIVHCVAELVPSNYVGTNNLLKALESQLSQWLEFECEIRDRSRFTIETELSERVLILVLKRASEKVKIAILSALSKRQNLSLHLMEFVASWLKPENPSQELRVKALQMFAQAGQLLPTQILNSVIVWMNNEDQKTRDAAEWVLLSQKTWPEDILRAVMAHIEGPVAEIKQRAAELLQEQHQMPENVLRTIALWLERPDEFTRLTALAVFQGQSELPEDIIYAVAAQFGDQDEAIQVQVFEILNIQPRLPENILENMATWLENQNDGLQNELGPEAHRQPLRRNEGELSISLLHTIFLRLKSQDANIQARAMRSLQRIPYRKNLFSATFYGDFIRVMALWVGFHDRAMRKFALEELSWDDQLPEDVVNTVVAHILEQEEELRQIACKILQHQLAFSARTSSVMVSWLGGEDILVRRTALEVLRRERTLPGSVLEAVLVQLKHQDGSIRESALSTLSKLWRRSGISHTILRAVTEKLYDDDRATVKAALDALRGYWTRQALPDDVVGDVVAQLNHPDTAIRRAVLKMFRDVGFRDTGSRKEQVFSDTIVHAIAAQLESQDNDIKEEALRALKAFGNRHAFPEGILEAVVTRIQDEYWRIRMSAFEALPNQGTSPDHDWEAEAVARFQDTKEAYGVRCAALDALWGQQTWHENTLAAVVSRLHGGNDSVRSSSISALATRKELPENILSTLVSKLGDERIGQDAKRILLSQTRLSAGLAEAMLQRFRYGGLRFKLDALEVLRAQPNLPEPILRGTIPWIHDKEWGVRHSVVDLLGTDTMLPLDALQDITKLLDEWYPRVRLAVLTALRGQRALPDAILSPKDLYPVWVKRCFKEHSYCFIEDGRIHVELPEGFGRITLEGDPVRFREEIYARQRELGMPTSSGHHSA